MSTEYKVEPRWQNILTEIGLNSYDDYFKDNKSFKLLAREKTQVVYMVEAKGNTFFLKINTAERFRKIFRGLVHGSYSQPSVREVKNLIHIKQAGIPVMNLVAWGSRSILGIPQTSFILTEKVNGEDFDKVYFRSNYRTKLRLFASYGKLVAQVHNKSLDSMVRPQDMMCLKDARGELTFVLIDREDGSTKKVEYTSERAAQEFATILYHGVKRYKKAPSLREVVVFLREYIKERNDLKISLKKFMGLVIQETEKYMKSRKRFQEISAVINDGMRCTHLGIKIK